MKEKIEKFSLKQQILKYPMQNIVRYIASESPESTQTPSHTMSVCLERAPLTAHCSLSFWAGWWYSYEMLALDYTYRDIETETQYKHTNWPLCTLLELRAVMYISKPYIVWALLAWLLLLWRTRRMIHGPCFDGCVLLLTKSVDLLPSILINYSVKCPANNRRNANQ